MVWIIVIGCFLVGLNIMFSYLELLPYIDAAKGDVNKVVNTRNAFYQFFGYIILPFKLLSHIHLLLPTLIDLGSMWVLTHTFSLGAGLAGGLTGLFASNLVSVLVFCKTHKGHVWASIFSMGKTHVTAPHGTVRYRADRSYKSYGVEPVTYGEYSNI